ncbi:hypothetical protein T09_1453 [Trichinella sp. T9]|nr:hypothetical protein T09_1453 [Trichinella sp. T9]
MAKLCYISRNCYIRASLNSSASHLFQTPPPFSDWLYADRLHAIDRFDQGLGDCCLSTLYLIWREGVIVGQQGQVTWFVQVGRMRWKRHTNQMRHRNIGIADGLEEKGNEMGSLLEEALPAENSPGRNAAVDENLQDTETLDIFQDQISTPPEGSVDSPKATVHAESSSTTEEIGDKEHKPDGSVTIKQDEVLQKPRRSNRVRKPPNRLSI